MVASKMQNVQDARDGQVKFWALLQILKFMFNKPSEVSHIINLMLGEKPRPEILIHLPKITNSSVLEPGLEPR